MIWKRSIRMAAAVLAAAGLVLSGNTGCSKSEDLSETVQDSGDPGTGDQSADEMVRIAESYQDVYEQAVKEGEESSSQTAEKILECIGKLGYTAVDTDQSADMVNHEAAEEFCLKAQTGEAAETTIFLLHDSGGLTRYDLHSHNGKLDVREQSLSWVDGEPELTDAEEYEAVRWTYSNEEYLFFEKYYPDGYDGPSGNTALRIKPLEKKCREMNQKYIEPIGFEKNNMFITEWDGSDFGALDFYDLYDIMYFMKYGEYHPYVWTAEGTVYEIPAAEFEEVILSYIDITREKLRERLDYNSGADTYVYRPRGTADMRTVCDIPWPEVTGYEENTDGTVTLRVKAVYMETEDACAIESEVTVEPRADGTCRYVSCHVLSGKNKNNTDWYPERLTEEEWNEHYNR